MSDALFLGHLGPHLRYRCHLVLHQVFLPKVLICISKTSLLSVRYELQACCNAFCVISAGMMQAFCSAAHMACRFCAAHKKLSDWLFASLICGFGLPLSFFLWYFNLYKGAIRDSSFRSAAHAQY